MKWCNPCALVWVVIGAAIASNIYLNVHWTYCIVAVVVLIPLIAVVVHEQREDIHDGAQSMIAEVWWLFKGWKRPAPKDFSAEKRTVP